MTNAERARRRYAASAFVIPHSLFRPMFRGVLVPTLTPVAPGGGVDGDALRSHAEWLIGKGVHGLYPCGSTGEGPRLTAAERRLVVRATCEAAAGRVPVLAGIWGANRDELLAEAKHAAECGAAAVAVTAPVYFRPSAGAIFEHFRALAEASRSACSSTTSRRSRSRSRGR